MKYALILSLLSIVCTANAASKPNVIVIFTDDQGYADLGLNGQVRGAKTPNLDRMAQDGALCTAGYITAPQCSPSRAGMLTGRYQQRFDFDNISKGPLPLSEKTLAERMHEAGYRTGFVGKWHLEPNISTYGWARKELGYSDRNQMSKIPFEKILPYYPQNRGFEEFFKGEFSHYWINYGLDGKDRRIDGEWLDISGFRIDIQTDAALAFIERSKNNPFFLYLAYFAPHNPLESTPKYLSRFPGKMPERRRYALSMISAIDDGIGAIRELLVKLGLNHDTLIFFASDNGAPLKIDMKDLPIPSLVSSWDGSLNTPWVGEKGMLMEGGVRVPFIVTWPGKIPAGIVFNESVSALDIMPTSLSAAEVKLPENLDGIDLIPFLTGMVEKTADRDLYWRFWDQAAIRRGHWKYIRLTNGRELLYDLASPRHENANLIAAHPEKAQELRTALEIWSQGLIPSGLANGPLNRQEQRWYNHYLKLEE